MINQPSPKRLPRHGAAAAELAICLPVMFLIAYGTIELCTIMHTGQSLKIASYEAARVGVVPKATEGDVRFQCESILDDRGVRGYEIVLDPADPGSLREGEFFRVTINANSRENSLMGGFPLLDRIITRRTGLRAD